MGRAENFIRTHTMGPARSAGMRGIVGILLAMTVVLVVIAYYLGARTATWYNKNAACADAAGPAHKSSSTR